MSDSALRPGSSPEDVLHQLERVAKYSNSDLTTLYARDAAEKLLSVAIYATGHEATALERYLKRRGTRKTDKSLEQSSPDGERAGKQKGSAG